MNAADRTVRPVSPRNLLAAVATATPVLLAAPLAGVVASSVSALVIVCLFAGFVLPVPRRAVLVAVAVSAVAGFAGPGWMLAAVLFALLVTSKVTELAAAAVVGVAVGAVLFTVPLVAVAAGSAAAAAAVLLFGRRRRRDAAVVAVLLGAGAVLWPAAGLVTDRFGLAFVVLVVSVAALAVAAVMFATAEGVPRHGAAVLSVLVVAVSVSLALPDAPRTVAVERFGIEGVGADATVDVSNLERCVATGGDVLMAVACYSTSLVHYYETHRDLPRTIRQVRAAFGAAPPLGPHFQNNCHETLHFLGRAVAEDYEDDPRRAIHDGTDLCSAGFGHGIWEIIYADMSDDEFIEEMPTLCRGWDGLERSEEGSAGIGCRHILGHSLASRFRDEVESVAHLCLVRDPLVADNAEVSRDEVQQRNNCLAGLFMENFLDLTRNRSVELAALDMFAPCVHPDVAVSDEIAWGCYNEVGALVAPAHMFEPSPALRACREHADTYDLVSNSRHACYDSVARAVAPAIEYQVGPAIEQCDVETDDELRAWCARGLGAAIYFNSNVRAMGESVCTALTDGEMLELCRGRLDEIEEVLGVSRTAN